MNKSHSLALKTQVYADTLGTDRFIIVSASNSKYAPSVRHCLKPIDAERVYIKHWRLVHDNESLWEGLHGICGHNMLMRNLKANFIQKSSHFICFSSKTYNIDSI